MENRTETSSINLIRWVSRISTRGWPTASDNEESNSMTIGLPSSGLHLPLPAKTMPTSTAWGMGLASPYGIGPENQKGRREEGGGLRPPPFLMHISITMIR